MEEGEEKDEEKKGLKARDNGVHKVTLNGLESLKITAFNCKLIEGYQIKNFSFCF